MIRIVCDNCGRTLKEGNEKKLNWWAVEILYNIGGVSERDTLDLCEDCKKRFKKFITQFGADQLHAFNIINVE